MVICMEFIRMFRKIITKVNPVLSNKIMYCVLMKKKLNLKNPQTFNEKINWLKIYKYTKDNYISKNGDKYRLHEVLRENNLSKYSVNLLGVWDNANDIDWEKLPNKFVLKCNHGSKYNIICSNKEDFDKQKAIKKLNKWLKEDFGLVSGELHYSGFDRKIICEEYLGKNIVDFQIWCTYGEILFVVIINNPHGLNEKATYDENWNRLNFVTSLPKINHNVKKPKYFEKMKDIAKELSKNLIFLRLDFYILENDTIKISEMTFSPSSGFIFWNPSDINDKLGKKINLEKVKNK